MKSQQFHPSEIPYGTLAKFGLTQDMIEDLPQTVPENIPGGRRSPVLPIQMTDDEGNVIKARTRFALVRLDGNDVEIMFYPQLANGNLDRFTPEAQKALLAN